MNDDKVSKKIISQLLSQDVRVNSILTLYMSNIDVFNSLAKINNMTRNEFIKYLIGEESYNEDLKRKISSIGLLNGCSENSLISNQILFSKDVVGNIKSIYELEDSVLGNMCRSVSKTLY